jgi:hypothetical protein
MEFGSELRSWPDPATSVKLKKWVDASSTLAYK